MAHYNYFDNQPKFRARLVSIEGATGASNWTLECRTDWQSDDWKLISECQMPIDLIEERIYNGFYDELG